MEQKAMIIGEETVKKYLSVEDVIDICEKTWRWYGEDKVVMPSKITTDMTSQGVAGWFNSMPAYIAPMDTAGLKLVGGYDANKALGLAYLGGGSRDWAWHFVSDLASCGDISGDVWLYDTDMQAAKNNVIIGERYKTAEGMRFQWSYHAAETIEEALTSADFVV